jgi:cytochrome c oxidase assembly protein subunit 15
MGGVVDPDERNPAPDDEMKQSRLATFAWGTLALNLGVILWGAYVRATGSGAGCGSHWPLCNGEVLPRSPGLETVIEFTHRLTSGLALLAVIGMWIWSRRLYPAGHLVRKGATLSLVFIIIEALLGAGLVLFELVADDDSMMRAFSMVAHLLNTFVLIAVLSLTAWWASGHADPLTRGPRGALPILAAAAAAVLFVGATGAIAALGDTLFPSASLEEGLRNSFSSDSHPLIQLRKYHPLAAILTGAGVVAAARYLSRATRDATTARLGRLLMGIYVAQIIAGTVNIILLAPVAMQLLHLLLADLLWITLVLFGASALAANQGVAGTGRPHPAMATTRP